MNLTIWVNYFTELYKGHSSMAHLHTLIYTRECEADLPLSFLFLVHGQVIIIFVLSVGLSVCLCRVSLSRLWSDFDETWTYVTCLGL